MIRRTLTLLAAVLIGLPWAVLPAFSGSSCAKGMTKDAASCAYCAPESRAAYAATTVSAGCCSYAPGSQTTPLQASGASLSPKPHHTPDAPVAAMASLVEIVTPDAVRIARSPERRLPAHAPPTETTHLLL
ncbi:MAG TPA: hypothetical protein VLT84_09185 [Acidobacteriota bacterium]|nr:hypothetical protein [Acidobacteriota bacterium]